MTTSPSAKLTPALPLDLTERALLIREKVQENVAGFVLEALRMNDPAYQDNAEFDRLVFFDATFYRNGEKKRGEITIWLADDYQTAEKPFLMSVRAYDAAMSTWPKSFDGAGLEDALIKLADI